MAGGRARGHGLGRPRRAGARGRGAPSPAPEQIAAIYRALRKGREDGKDEPGAADFYYGEMEMRRQRPRGQEAERRAAPAGERLVLWLYWLVSGYGLRASRALASLALTVVVFALLFDWWGTRPDQDFGRTLLFSLQSTSSLSRVPETPGFALTAAGELMQVVLRLLGPLFFGLALFSLRGRVKRLRSVPRARMPFEIRSAAPAEFPAVADLCVAAYAPFLVGDHHYVAVLRDVARRAAEAELLVAADRETGSLLGTVTFVPDGGPLGEIAGPAEAEFRMLAVDPAAQAGGVGTALARHVLEDSRRRAKGGSCARACRRCAPRTGSTSGSGSGARPSVTVARAGGPARLVRDRLLAGDALAGALTRRRGAEKVVACASAWRSPPSRRAPTSSCGWACRPTSAASIASRSPRDGRTTRRSCSRNSPCGPRGSASARR